MTNFKTSFLVGLSAIAVACTGEISGDTGHGGQGGSDNTGGASNASSSGMASSSSTSSGSMASSSGSSTSSSSSGSGPMCTSLADAVRTTNVTVSVGSSSGRAITAARGDGSVVAWAGTDGKVHVLPLDANDKAAGNEISVEGMAVYGVAASANDVALLVSRMPDYMTFMRIDNAGQTLAKTDLVGGGNHNTQGVEWFGEFARTGRLVAQPDGKFVAYHALHRRWPDGIGHQGDTLRYLNADGSAAGGGWGWGCSHSMDERLAVGPAGLVPICISDCYPGKGIYFQHNAAKITDDPNANCAGGYSTALGGLVVVADGFFLVYQDANGGGHLGRFDMNGMSVSERDLSEGGSSRLARYEDGLLLGSGGTTLQKLDAMGVATSETVNVMVPLPDQDFESRPNGEVAWASIQGTNLTVVRVQACP
jgi:hypothetical protein